MNTLSTLGSQPPIEGGKGISPIFAPAWAFSSITHVSTEHSRPPTLKRWATPFPPFRNSLRLYPTLHLEAHALGY